MCQCVQSYIAVATWMMLSIGMMSKGVGMVKAIDHGCSYGVVSKCVNIVESTYEVAN